MIKRYECPQHGNTLAVRQEDGAWFCVPHARYIEGVEVEYVRADDYRVAVEAIMQARDEFRKALADDEGAEWLRDLMRDFIVATAGLWRGQ